MERIKTLETRSLCDSAKNGGCGECQTSCQSACNSNFYEAVIDEFRFYAEHITNFWDETIEKWAFFLDKK